MKVMLAPFSLDSSHRGWPEPDRGWTRSRDDLEVVAARR
jgi:hypothetical protein